MFIDTSGFYGPGSNLSESNRDNNIVFSETPIITIFSHLDGKRT